MLWEGSLLYHHKRELANLQESSQWLSSQFTGEALIAAIGYRVEQHKKTK